MFEVNDPEFHWFLQEVKKKLGIDLTGYKQHRVHRRVGILMKRHSVESYGEYLKMITSDPTLRDEFLDKMTINVTEFFRNPEKWQELKERFLPEIIREKGTRNLKMWSAGCSTGEEPYTMAIILVELRIPETVRVLATDIDPWVLEKARKGFCFYYSNLVLFLQLLMLHHNIYWLPMHRVPFHYVQILNEHLNHPYNQ